jgi:tetratricopeptide (TPR) repeat protein
MQRVLALVVGLLAASTSSFSADWTRVQSAHFRLMGDASEADIKTIAVRLEQFRDTFGVIYPTLAEDENAPPMIVFVFKNTKTWEPYRPRFNGKAVDLGGYFLSGRDVNYIALTADAADVALPVIFHEYTHLLVHRVVPALPPWLDEGLADYYSTFDVAGNARQATYGKPIARHITLLMQRFLPLQELFAVTHESPLYNEGDKRSIFYAESWALVHYAFVGRPALGPKLLEFAARVNSGAPVDAAFTQALGIEMSQLERELQEYVRLKAFQYQFTKFSERLITRINTNASRVSEPETEAWLGDLLGHMDRADEAIKLLEKAIATDPTLGIAHASLGTIYVRQKKFDAAITELRQAVDLTSDSEFVHYYYGVGLLQRRANLPATSSSTDLQNAEAAFVRALELRPGFAEAMTQLGYTRLFMGKLAEAREPLQRAWAIDPANYSAAFALAQVHLRAGEVAQARDLLGRIVALGNPALKRAGSDTAGGVGQDRATRTPTSGRPDAERRHRPRHHTRNDGQRADQRSGATPFRPAWLTHNGDWSAGIYPDVSQNQDGRGTQLWSARAG